MDVRLLTTCRYTGETKTAANAANFDQCSFCQGWTKKTEGDARVTAYNTTNVDPVNPNNKFTIQPTDLVKQEAKRCSHCGHPTLV
jgi:hypothetical protein